METLRPDELRQRLTQNNATVVDVREAHELEIAHLPGCIHLPLSQLAERWHEVKELPHVVLVCHHGMRSARAAQFLEKNGIQNLAHLGGGLDAWASEIDPTMPRY